LRETPRLEGALELRRFCARLLFGEKATNESVKWIWRLPYREGERERIGSATRKKGGEETKNGRIIKNFKSKENLEAKNAVKK